MELANILELIHAVSDSDLTEFNLQDDTLNISMSKEKTIVQQMAVNADPADAQQYQPVVQQAVHVESVNAVNDEVQTGSVVKSPLVGTYYAASSPENPPFVKVGDKVSKGQVLGILAPPEQQNRMTGSPCFVASSNERVIFSPTTYPMEAMRNLVSMAPITVRIPPMVASPMRIASSRCVFSLRSSIFCG